jgi:hypothetical protein
MKTYIYRTRFQRFLRWRRHWKNCWRDKPEQMEQARQKGVAAMLQGWKERNQNLRAVVATWPKSMSKSSFRARVQELIDSPDNLRARNHKTHRPDSMINRLRSNGFAVYNPSTKRWVNLTAGMQDTREIN